MKNRPVVAVLLLTLVLLIGIGSLQSGSAAEDMDMIWTKWDADHYAIVDDDETIWVGTGTGLLRWDKASQTHKRISTAEGLPHRNIFSGAADGAGNRWFGGDAGLSRLDSNEEWTHYNKSNSGIYSDSVESIAATADGSVWLGHTESSYVSRLRTDGSWTIYPNRHTAVSLAHKSIQQTLNQNDLWTVAGDDLWVGYDVFNGTDWEKRQPPGFAGSPLVVASDSKHRVWVLEGWTIYLWDGEKWEDYPLDTAIGATLSTLVVDDNDRVWVAGTEAVSPYGHVSSGYAQLDEQLDYFSFYEDKRYTISSAVALLPTDEGMWGIGPNWLLTSDGKSISFTDLPSGSFVSQAVVNGRGGIWVRSVNDYGGPLQVLDDKGTATMSDDQWTVIGRYSSISALEPAQNGDLWIGSGYYSRFSYPDPPTRFHGTDEIAYPPPLDPPDLHSMIEDIYVQDNQHIWFAFLIDNEYLPEFTDKGVYSLDDGGTPADFSDDEWASYLIETDGEYGLVAVVDSQLWYGDTSGLYRFQDPDWEQVSSEKVRGLVPGADGELYVDLESDRQVLIVEQDGSQQKPSIADLVENDLARVQATNRRNQMWTVAPDGAVWYWQTKYNNELELVRRDEQGITKINTPTTPTRSGYVEVDENNRVWLADGSLWRMSPKPDFSLEVGPSSWLMTPNGSRSGRIHIESKEGYQETVDLSISGLPAGVTAEIVPESLPAGESAVLTVTTDGAALGETTITIKGASGMLNRQRSFKLAVVEYATDSLLTIVAK